MKTGLTLTLLLTMAAAIASPVVPRANLKNVSAPPENVFAFKVSKKFKRGLVEIYTANGELIAKTALSNRKMVINFGEVESGIYIIQVKKHNTFEKFQFEKK